MPFTPEALRAQIEEAEAAIAAGEAAKSLLPHLKEALATFDAGSKTPERQRPADSTKTATVKKNPASGDFEPKYDKSAGQLAEDAVRQAGRDLTLRQIQNHLAAQGKELSDQAVSLGIKRNPKLKRVSAPRDSASKYAYRLVP